MRRPLQITEAHFDFSKNRLDTIDLSDEFERSKVYGIETKKRLAEILTLFIELCKTLTDVLALVFPLDETTGWTGDGDPRAAIQIRNCRSALGRWHTLATSRLPISERDYSSRRKFPGQNPSNLHESTVLYTNLMYMYYHTARIVMCHHEALHLSLLRKGRKGAEQVSVPRELQIISQNQQELRDATLGITFCHAVLYRLGLSRWLPVSAIGCTALPLLLNVLDSKLFPSSQPTSKEHQLKVLTEVMNDYEPQYDGVDWISEIVRHVVNITNREGITLTRSSSNVDWTDVFYTQPNFYLRRALVLDLSLRKGRLPGDDDFPRELRGTFTADFKIIRNPTTREDFLDFTVLDHEHIVTNQDSETEGSSISEVQSSANAASHTNCSDLAVIGELENELYFQLANGSEASETGLTRNPVDQRSATMDVNDFFSFSNHDTFESAGMDYCPLET